MVEYCSIGIYLSLELLEALRVNYIYSEVIS